MEGMRSLDFRGLLSGVYTVIKFGFDWTFDMVTIDFGITTIFDYFETVEMSYCDTFIYSFWTVGIIFYKTSISFIICSLCKDIWGNDGLTLRFLTFYFLRPFTV